MSLLVESYQRIAFHEERELLVESYQRIAFLVERVLVTEENLEEAAAWCGGRVAWGSKTVTNTDGVNEIVRVAYVKVDIKRPENERQTKAFPGDSILKSEVGFKVYTRRAFDRSFEPNGTNGTNGTNSITAADRDAFAHGTKEKFRAKNGEFVTFDFAMANPDLVVSESSYQKNKK